MVKLNNMLTEVWNEASRRQQSSQELNLKLFASSFFLLGLGVGSLQNHEHLAEALNALKSIEQQERTQRMTGLEKMESRLAYLT